MSDQRLKKKRPFNIQKNSFVKANADPLSH